MAGRLDGKVAVITGGGGGIGQVASEVFASEGARVVIAEYVEEAGANTVASISKKGGEATFIRTDVSVASDVKTMVDFALSKYGKIDVLYNNAGILPPEDAGTLDTPEEAWDKVFAVNVKGVWLCCRYGIPAMIESGGGSVINVASLVALMGSAVAQIAYTSSKGAVLSMTREMAVEFGRTGVRINALCPGPIMTPLMEDLLADEAKRARRLVHVPIGRFGEAEEVARAALFLASDDSSLMTGAALVCDGGISVAYVTPE